MTLNPKYLLERFSRKSAVDKIHMSSLGIMDTMPTPMGALPQQTGDITPDIACRVYSSSPYVNAAVRVVAGSLSTTPLKLYQTDPQGVGTRERKKGDLYKLLNFVNPHLTKSQLLEYTASWLMLSGVAYWAIEETDPKYAHISPYSIYPLNPRYVRIWPNSDTGTGGYFYQIGAKKLWLDDSQVVMFKNFSPYDYWHGHSNLNSLETSIQIERYGAKQTANFFQHAAIISGVLSVPTDIDEDEVRKVKKEFYSQYSGNRNAHRVMVLTNGMTYEPFKANLAADQHIVPILDKALETHGIVMGVPTTILIGKAERGTKLIESEELMWKKTIQPMGRMIEETLTKRLAWMVAGNLEFKFDYSNVEALRLQDLDRARVEVALVASGVYKSNEVRRSRGLPDWDGESADFGELARPVFDAKNAASISAAKASSSLSLPGSEGGRDQNSSSGESEFIDQTGKR